MKTSFSCILIVFIISGCTKSPPLQQLQETEPQEIIKTTSPPKIQPRSEKLVFKRDITMKHYFTFLDSVISKHPELSKTGLGEYILIHHNPWILDSIRSFDYYVQKKKGKFIYDLSQQIIFRKGDSIILPDSIAFAPTIHRLKSAQIDLNIPEYRLRVIEEGDTILTIPVRVGRNSEEYLELVGQLVNLRTPRGKGEIVKVLRAPIFYDLHTGAKYEKTKRDDGRYTIMPAIPSLEPSINGIRYGYMLHATTNINTLGKAYSHGCIGMSEADAWSIYYNAPVGTKVNFRYDLNVVNHHRDTLFLKDIYHIQSGAKSN